jgi:hypothetical protein
MSAFFNIARRSLVEADRRFRVRTASTISAMIMEVITLMMNAVRTSEMSVYLYETTNSVAQEPES